MANPSMSVAGIDVGKAALDAAVAGSEERIRVSNDDAGHARLAAWLRQRGVTRVGLEASGGYERPVMRALIAEDFALMCFQPIQVRAYATLRLKRAKSDPIDAGLIADCAAFAPAREAHGDAELEALAGHLTMIEQIEEDIVRAKTRRESCLEQRPRDHWSAETKRLKRLRLAELKALAGAVRALPEIARRLSLVLSVPGIGQRTALALVIRMPELGALTREQIASLAGLAPFDRDSGVHRGQRHIAGGRSRLRTSLYAAALPAAFRWNPALVDIYKRLTAKGKPHKVALVACARKLLIYANTVLARGTPWLEQKPAT